MTRIGSSADVVVCGGGPVGLSLAFLLGRAGLQVTLLERRPTTTTLPKGQYLHASTGELFRQWGVWDLLHDKGWSTESSNGQGFYVTVAGGPVAGIRAVHGSHDDYVRKWEPLSPVYPRKVPASEYEAALRRQASNFPNAALHFNARVVDVAITGRRVRVVVEDAESQQTQTVAACYLVACDGAHSFVRSRLGRGQDHGPTFGNQVLVEFRADLDATLGRDGFFHSFVLHPQYAGWFGSQHPQSGLWRYSFRHDEDEPPPHDIVLERIRGALGMPDIELELVRLHRFDYTTGLLRHWREGPVFFAGDAARWHSPWGGFGMNSGIQDAANLAWKLALAVRGVAPDALLDTYETERRSRALLTVKSATYNSLHYQAIAESVRIGEGSLMRQGSISPEGIAFLAQRVEPHGDNSVLHTGYQLGTVYAAGALRREADALPTATLKDYVETTLPGTRAPHAWLQRPDGSQVSTIDIWGERFTLVGHRLSSYWSKACCDVGNAVGVEIDLLDVDSADQWRSADDKFPLLFSARLGGATLVRPDGFTGARLHAHTLEEARADLLAAMRMILCASTPSTPAAARTAEATA